MLLRLPGFYHMSWVFISKNSLHGCWIHFLIEILNPLWNSKFTFRFETFNDANERFNIFPADTNFHYFFPNKMCNFRNYCNEIFNLIFEYAKNSARFIIVTILYSASSISNSQKTILTLLLSSFQNCDIHFCIELAVIINVTHYDWRKPNNQKTNFLQNSISSLSKLVNMLEITVLQAS